MTTVAKPSPWTLVGSDCFVDLKRWWVSCPRTPMALWVTTRRSSMRVPKSSGRFWSAYSSFPLRSLTVLVFIDSFGTALEGNPLGLFHA